MRSTRSRRPSRTCESSTVWRDYAIGPMTVDIESFKTRSKPVSLEGIDLDEFRRRPLHPDALRCLQYMHDVEYHTVCYLRDMLVTPAHLDPEVTTFLTLWNVEEYFHGEAIGAVLAA